MSKLANFVGFQACWFACVLGAARGMEWLGPLSTSLFLGWALLRSHNAARELVSLALVAVLGTLVDSLQLHMGWLKYAGTPLAGVLAPAWIVALWIVFAMTFDSSLAWLARRRAWFAIFGAVGAPCSYWGGARLGAVSFGEPLWPSILGISACWGAALPLASWLVERVRSATDEREGASAS
ncbi:MAG: DUF2878 domain-containing protein [Planctomycetes bacterium]|nr:DUF2878 domain-containing protein [Planctomycetota bacterium]